MAAAPTTATPVNGPSAPTANPVTRANGTKTATMSSGARNISRLIAGSGRPPTHQVAHAASTAYGSPPQMSEYAIISPTTPTSAASRTPTALTTRMSAAGTRIGNQMRTR